MGKYNKLLSRLEVFCDRGLSHEAAAALRELEAENDERGAAITKAAVQVTALRARVAELEVEITTQSDHIAALLIKNADLRAERDRLRARNIKLEADCGAWEATANTYYDLARKKKMARAYWEIEEISNGFIGYWNIVPHDYNMSLKEKDKTYFARDRRDCVNWIALEIFDEIKREENEL